MKYTNRSKRLEKYLSQLGWETGCGMLVARYCKKCNSRTGNSDHVFCPCCGAKLGRGKTNDAEVLTELESAIAYALGEAGQRLPE